MARHLWPPWWDWELVLSPRLLERMSDREFTETDLRLMLKSAIDLHRGRKAGRWIVTTRWERRPWIVVVEPEPERGTLLVVTAFEYERF